MNATHSEMSARTHASLMTHNNIMGGVRFLPNTFTSLAAPASIMVEIGFGVDLSTDSGTWALTDVTASLRLADRVSITQGRQDEQGQASASTCKFTLLNSSGDFTPRRPASIYYPNVHLGVPVRVTLNTGTSGASVRFSGYIDGLTPSWDGSAKLATVQVSASGILRRLGQGKTSLRTPLQQSILSQDPLHYWPMDDGTDAAAAVDIVTGARPLRAIRQLDAVHFGQETDLAGTDAILTMDDKGVMYTSVPSYGGGTYVLAPDGLYYNTPIVFDLWFKLYAVVAVTNAVLLRSDTPFGNVYELKVVAPFSATAKVVFTLSSGGVASLTLDTDLGSPGMTVNPYDGLWHNVLVAIWAAQSDPDHTTVYGTLTVDGTLADSQSAGPVGDALSIIDVYLQNTPVTGTTGTVSLAGLALFTDTSVTSSNDAGAGYAGETASDRIARLCAEFGIPCTVVGDSDTTMGAQPADTFLNLLRQCEEADVGVLTDE